MAATTTRALPKISSNSPDFNNPLVTAHNSALDALDAWKAVEVDSANAAIGLKEGTVFITKASAEALTLALPTAGLPSAGGDDGKELEIVSTTAYAHTVTTPASGLNGASHIATFGTAVGNNIRLKAYSGGWYVISSIGITLS